MSTFERVGNKGNIGEHGILVFVCFCFVFYGGGRGGNMDRSR